MQVRLWDAVILREQRSVAGTDAPPLARQNLQHLVVQPFRLHDRALARAIAEATEPPLRSASGRLEAQRISQGDGRDTVAEIATFAALKAAGAGQPQVEDAVRQLLLARYQAYHDKGLAGIAPYARGKDKASQPADDLRRATQAAKGIKKYAAAFEDVLMNFPQGTPAGLKQRFFCIRYGMDGRPNFALRHRLAMPVDDAYVVADRNFYVSSGYNDTQAVAGLVPVADGTVVVYVARTTTDSGDVTQRAVDDLDGGSVQEYMMARRTMQEVLIGQREDLTIAAPAHGDVTLVEATPVGSTATATPDLRAPGLYLNRELTWLEFNRRVLHEAQDRRNPLLERVKFLAITAANLDEFFMKRIGGLKQQVGAGMQELTVDGRTPQQQITECYERVREIERQQSQLFRELRELLKEHDICLKTYDELSAEEQQALRDEYCRTVFPLVTPQAMDSAHPFPFVSNLSLNLLVTLHYPKDPELLRARVKFPVGTGIKRFLRVGQANHFVPLGEVMAHNLDLLFPAMEVASCELFRVTRNANTERDEEEADDLLAMIESELRDRRFAPIVRLEVYASMSSSSRGMLAAELGLNEHADVFDVDGMMALRDLMEVATIDAPALHDPPHHSIDHPRLPERRNIFHIIRDAGSLLLQHPYESFATSVERFLREASKDPKVRAIKMILYRTSPDSKILDYLCEAASDGKQVAVVVELKARFDEAANIRFANRLEDFGIHVTYGVVGLKTHGKVILVVRQDYDGLRRYAHIGTGNYHPDTARLYSDFGLLTCDDAVGQDLTELFNYLTTGYRPKRAYRKLLPAPTLLKKGLLAKIEREITVHSAGMPGLIQLKTNALEDADIAAALYRASQAGVKVDLLVRDTCVLRPGLPGVSENIRVVSVIGRFLEHGRIYYFRNGGDEEYFIGSADCMKRNLEGRVEVVIPIEEPLLRKELRTVLDVQLSGDHGEWVMQSDGTYVRRAPEGDFKSSQQLLIELAEKRQREAGRRRKLRPKGVARRAAKGVP